MNLDENVSGLQSLAGISNRGNLSSEGKSMFLLEFLASSKFKICADN